MKELVRHLCAKLTRDSQAADEARSLNPAGRIPVLIHDGRVLTESLAIVEYIDEVGTVVGPRSVTVPGDVRH